tara:strand:- start:30 stop:1112 length:1083 start_codon:yes stop_codon:yes gene_type:complete
MAIRKLFKSAVKRVDPTPWLSEKDRKRFYTAEDYYNEKYPKLNITFPRYELDIRNQHDFSKNPYKAYSKYNSDVRSLLNSKNFRLPRLSGETHDEIALKGLKWVMNGQGNLTYVSDENTSAWNHSNLYRLNAQLNDWLLNPEKKFDLNEYFNLKRLSMETINEYWSYSYQTYQRGTGDCEDGTVLLYDILRKSGVPAWKMRVNAGYVNNSDGSPMLHPNGQRDGGHVWLTYYVESQFWKGKDKREDKWVVLDWCNGSKYLNDVTTPLDERVAWDSELIYAKDLDFSFNEDYCWSTGNGKVVAPHHTENCPVVSSKVQISPEMKKRFEEREIPEDIWDSEMYGGNCTCRCTKCLCTPCCCT